MFKLPVHTELLYVEIISSDCNKHLLECITYVTLTMCGVGVTECNTTYI